MPRGLPPTVNVAVTLSVAVSILDTVPEPSLEAYAIGAAAPGSDAAADNAAAIRIWKKRMAAIAPRGAGRSQWSRHKRSVMLHDLSLLPWPCAKDMSNSAPRGGCRMRRILPAAMLVAIAAPAPARAQDVVRIDPLVITATRIEERAFDLPVAIDSIGAARIQQGQLQINLSESLSRVPGLVVQNRWNYAQDLQVSSRGFGARASFGVRGIRLYQDGIPATMPDGQGQTGSFSLASAQ